MDPLGDVISTDSALLLLRSIFLGGLAGDAEPFARTEVAFSDEPALDVPENA